MSLIFSLRHSPFSRPLVTNYPSHSSYGERELPNRLRPCGIGKVNRIPLAGRLGMEDGGGAHNGSGVSRMVGMPAVVGV